MWNAVSSRIWTRVAMSIPYDDNHYTTGTSFVSTYIKREEINIMKIINDKTFNLRKSLLNHDNRYMKVSL